MRNRFVGGDTTRINLAEPGDWIEVKQSLNTGDQRKQDNLAIVATVVVGKDGKETVINRTDWSRYEIMRAALWLTDWHIHDSMGKVPPLTIEAICALDPDDFEEIDAAIFKHMMGVADDKKKAKALRARAAGAAPSGLASSAAPTSTS